MSIILALLQGVGNIESLSGMVETVLSFKVGSRFYSVYSVMKTKRVCLFTWFRHDKKSGHKNISLLIKMPPPKLRSAPLKSVCSSLLLITARVLSLKKKYTCHNLVIFKSNKKIFPHFTWAEAPFTSSDYSLVLFDRCLKMFLFWPV